MKQPQKKIKWGAWTSMICFIILTVALVHISYTTPVVDGMAHPIFGVYTLLGPTFIVAITGSYLGKKYLDNTKPNGGTHDTMVER